MRDVLILKYLVCESLGRYERHWYHEAVRQRKNKSEMIVMDSAAQRNVEEIRIFL